MNMPRFELLRRSGAGGNAEIDNLRLDVEGMRVALEGRLQAQEPRLRLAAQEAIAFAERRLEAQEIAHRARLEPLRRDVERLRAIVETQAQTQDHVFQTLREDASARAAQALEPRIRLATQEAVGFAEQTRQDQERAHQTQLNALATDVERLREIVETRLQTQDGPFHALPAESPARVAEALEPRILLATQEAIAFAEQRLERQEAALRALGRRFAEFAREPAAETAPERPALETAAYVMGSAGADAHDARRLSLSEESEEAFVRDAANLPIAPGGASRLVAARVIEHISPAALEARVLPHWRSRMAAGGELIVSTRDGPAFLADLSARGDFSRWRADLFGPGAHALRNLLDPAALVALLTQAGFAPEPPTRGDGFMLRVVARA